MYALALPGVLRKIFNYGEIAGKFQKKAGNSIWLKGTIAGMYDSGDTQCLVVFPGSS